MEKNRLNEEALEDVTGGTFARIDFDTGKYIPYIVVPGDRLDTVAHHSNVTADILYELNKSEIGPDPDKLAPGMILRIPTL